LFNSKTILGSQTSVDDASAELSKNIDLPASHSLKKNITKNKKKQVNQKWFDLNLRKMQTHLFNDGKMFSKYQNIFILEITFTNYRENIIKQENKHIVNIRSHY
jgi:post-segregation antitoxin (ccd killing protein)